MIRYILLFFLLFIPSVTWAGTQTMVPTAMIFENGFSATCAVTTVDDDPDADDNDWCVAANNNTDTDIRVDFDTPTNNLQTGAGLQEVRVLFRAFDTGQTGDPTFLIDIYNSGTDTSETTTSCNGTVVDGQTAGDQVFSCTWDAANIADSTGASVRVNVQVTKTGGSPGIRNTLDHGAVEWIANTEAGSSRRAIISRNTNEKRQSLR